MLYSALLLLLISGIVYSALPTSHKLLLLGIIAVILLAKLVSRLSVIKAERIAICNALRSADPVTIKLESSGRSILTSHAGEGLAMDLVATYSSRVLVILRCNIADGLKNRTVHLILWFDSLAADDFRRLRVWLSVALAPNQSQLNKTI